MNFSIHLDFFIERISDDVHKKLIIDHHNLITEHKEALNSYIKFKKDLLTLYQKYNSEVSNINISNKSINIHEKYFDIMKFMHELEESIKYLENDAINQKEFFKKNIFYFSNFK